MEHLSRQIIDASVNTEQSIFEKESFDSNHDNSMEVKSVEQLTLKPVYLCRRGALYRKVMVCCFGI